ncbi:MAG: serine/threonine protein kinase [Gammaproteobacteria bacterium]|nr:serine/threonine protein kinase [Gammaproteobacteria bacterium]MCP5195456.1 serine/threonine protein kinase [Gammaproteobacteria bacterium]
MLRAGQHLGAYRIENLLGRGAMGAVYQGIRLDDGQPVAIKTVLADLLVRPERAAILKRFRQEAAIGMRLRHPLVVQVHDCGEQDGILYLAMDLVEGQELGRLLEQRPSLSLGMNLAIVLQVLNALAYAHEQGVIHRDIKPANIMVRQDYTIALTDFGIAHVSGSELTHTGELLGSPLYIAPEQLRGESVDQRADLFSVGVVLYYLLTRRKPFVADSLAALMYKILQETPPPPSTLNQELPAVFDAVLHRVLAKHPAQRFSSALEFAAALRQARIDALETTVVVSSSRRGRLAARQTKAQDQATMLISTSGILIEQMTALVQECLAERATGARLDQLLEWLEAWFSSTDRTVDPVERERLQRLCTDQSLMALAERIRYDAPLPGLILRNARGDWLELVRLFALLRNASHRLGADSITDLAYDQILRQLTGAFLNYSSMLNRLLFSEDGPQLARISADFMRMELLQLALVELKADAEVRGMQQTLLLFANQVMARINALIRQFLDDRDPLVRFDVTNLLVEVEELIVLAERLLEWGAETAAVEVVGPGGTTMAEFIENAQALSRLLTDELIQHLQQEEGRLMDIGQSTFEAGQSTFIGHLRQLGLLYRFAARLEPSVQIESLHQLTTEIYRSLQQLTDLLLTALKTTDPQQPLVATDPLWARLSVIAELAEQFAWQELQQHSLQAIRQHLIAA